MNFPFYIAKRYLFTKSRNNAINFITIIAAIGIVLGSASLFIVLSGFAGLKEFTLQFTSIVDPDIKAESTLGKSFILTKEHENKLSNLESIASYSKIIEDRAFVSSDNKRALIKLKGVDENYQQVTAVDSILALGSWLSQKTTQIVVGNGIANKLSFGVLDYSRDISIYVPKPGKGQITELNLKNAFNSISAISVGLFEVNEDLDNNYVYAPIDLVKALLNYKDKQITAIEFKLKEGFTESDARKELQPILENDIVLKNREQLNDSLYKMLNTENLAVYLIFTLVLIIALFNIVGSIIMMILDKRKTLNTLFNIGSTLKEIRKIFFLQGTLMTLAGGFLGLVIALIILFLQKAFSLVMITPSLPYPITIKLGNIILVFVTISVLGILASKIASTRITKSLVQTQ